MDVPILLIGGTYDLITPLISEQFGVFLSANNSYNRFLIVEGASHFSPIRINKRSKEKDDIFKISEPFIGSNPLSVQNIYSKVIIEFLNKVKMKEKLKIISNQKDSNLEFHILDRKTINKISEN